MTRAPQVQNQEASGHLARRVHGNENFMWSPRSYEVSGEIGGGKMLMEGVNPTNLCVSGALQVPNQEKVVEFGRGIYCNENGIIMSTGSRQVA